MSYDKMHDGIMNNLEWQVESQYGLDYLQYSSTQQYTDMSNAIYSFLKDVENGTLDSELVED